MSESELVDQIMHALKCYPNIVARKRHGTAWGVAGDPDIYGCIDGRHFELEVKRPDGPQPTKLQRARLHSWATVGAIFGVVRSVEDALRILGIRPQPRRRPRS